MLEDLATELELAPEILKNRSFEVLRVMLHQYSALSISTIDKFTNRLIRTFAQDLQLNANYEVELDSPMILGEAVDRMLANLDAGSPLAELLIRFLNIQLEEGKSPRAEIPLLQMGKSLFEEGAIYPISVLKEIDHKDFIKTQSQLFKRNKQWEKEVSDKALTALKLIDDNGIDHKLFNRGYFPKQLIKWGNGSFSMPSQTVLSQINGEADLYSKSKAKEAAPLMELIESDLLKQCQETLEIIKSNLSVYEISKLIGRSILGMGVLAELDRNLQAIKQESNRLPIGEFNKLISARLQEQPAAFLYERMGDRYQHYFIDEFQDTSKLQWQNIVPLVNNAMSQGGTGMLVGDAKQSIYRWRGGEVEQFIDLSENRDTSNRVLANQTEIELYSREAVFLENNWRSRRNIVEFNNSFFETITDTPDDKEGRKLQRKDHIELFKKAHQEVKGDEGGYVEIKRLVYNKAEPDEYVEAQCQQCLETISDALKDGYELKDIAILVRTKSNAATLSKFLIDNGLSIVSPDSLTLDQSEEIGVLVAFLQLFFRPDDKEGRLKFLSWLYNKGNNSELDEHEFLKLWTHTHMGSLFEFLEGELEDFSQAVFSSLSLVEKLYQLMNIFQFDWQQDAFLRCFWMLPWILR